MSVEVVYMVDVESTAGIVYIVLPEFGRVGVCRKGSGSSMTRSAATTETGDPMAVPWICW